MPLHPPDSGDTGVTILGSETCVPSLTRSSCSGDTAASDDIVTLAQNVDPLICESSFPDALKKKGHLTPSQADDIATRAKVGNRVLTHLYPEWGTVDIEKQCRKTYHGPLAVAEDLMKMMV
ncbi:MAG: MBL fold metallo-hydrolase [Desulfobacterales bacterium]